MLMEVKWIPQDLYPSKWFKGGRWKWKVGGGRWVVVGGWNKRGRWGRRVREGVDPPLAPYKHFHGERSCRDKTQMPRIRVIGRDETIGWLERMAVASK